jgi:polysaccharide pyruvyl transferase WcaK-like protein
MCSALTQFIEDNSSMTVRIISGDPEAQCRSMSATVEVVPRSAKAVLLSFMRSRVVCQGGGTIFHDSYVGQRLFLYWIKLSFWAILFWIARILGARVVMVGAGVGPLRHRLTRWISRLALLACTSIGVRDGASMRTIRSLSPRIRCELGFDLAALIPFDFAPLNQKNCPSRRNTLAISVCSLTEFLGDATINERYWSTLAEAIGRFHKEERPIRIMFFTLFRGGFSEGDEATAKLIASRLPNDIPVSFCSYANSVEDLWGDLAKCNWALCTRFHAAVAAYLSGCNFAVISYNRKLIDLADEIGLPRDRRVSANAPQPAAVWLGVLRSLATQDIGSDLLDPHQAGVRAKRAACEVFEAAGVLLAPQVTKILA